MASRWDQSGYALKRRFRRLSFGVIAAALVGGAGLAYGLQAVAGSRAELAVRTRANEMLALQSEVVNGILEKYRLLPPLLARRADIAALFERPWDPENREQARRKAIEIAGLSGAKDAALADAEGRIFASARNLYDNSSLQQTILFEAASQGRLGRETMSLDEDERAYVFAAAVTPPSGPKGVLAIYVRFDQIESTWSLSKDAIVVTDRAGTVFLGNREPWQLRLLTVGGEPVLKATTERDVVALPDGSRALLAQRFIPLLGWTLNVLPDYGEVAAARRTAGLIGLLIAALAGLSGWFMVKRREALEMRLRRDRASAIRLERQVRDRTKALSDSNASLRQAQSELVQSAKLAALGQMSATLSHEYNQPLAAIRTYADNARLLIERGRTGPADEAIGHIAGLVDRMSELSRTLLGFARRPGVTVQPVNLGAVVDEALLLAGPRAKKAGVAVRKQGFDETVTVMGGRVRLTQVVVNLVNNAVDALTGVGAAIAIADPEIVISAEREEDGVTLTISDNGPGIAAENRERVFEPFFSTKAAGEGIGIGLSIVYTILKDLGASIEVGSGPAGGAAFVIRLKTQEGDRQT